MRVSSISCSHSSTRLTSRTCGRWSSGRGRLCAASLSAAAFMSHGTTCTPNLARVSAVARPCPLAAPVTIATRPVNPRISSEFIALQHFLVDFNAQSRSIRHRNGAVFGHKWTADQFVLHRTLIGLQLLDEAAPGRSGEADGSGGIDRTGPGMAVEPESRGFYELYDPECPGNTFSPANIAADHVQRSRTDHFAIPTVVPLPLGARNHACRVCT